MKGSEGEKQFREAAQRTSSESTWRSCKTVDIFLYDSCCNIVKCFDFSFFLLSSMRWDDFSCSTGENFAPNFNGSKSILAGIHSISHLEDELKGIRSFHNGFKLTTYCSSIREWGEKTHGGPRWGV